MITLLDIAQQKYAVLGLGKSGMAAAATLKASRADFVVWDDDAGARIAAEKAGYTVSDLTAMDPAGYKALVLSPDIPHTHPAPHPAVTRFKAAKIPVIGDIELLFRACPNATYIGITGTHGKSTLTALVGHMVKNSYRKIQIGGTHNAPALSLQPLGADGTYVLELSSYQLELMPTNRLRVAVLLNIAPNHLERHGGMNGYIAAKKRIISTGAPQTLVIGTDDPATNAIANEVRGWRHLQIEEISVEHTVRTGIELAGSIMMAHRLTGSKNIIDLATLTTLSGKHNWQNACAAFAVARAMGLTFDQIEKGLKTFPPKAAP